MINQIYRGYTKTYERFYYTHARKINKASFSHKRVTALLSLIFWSCFCLLHSSLTFPLSRRKLSPFRRICKNITSFGDLECTEMQKKRKTQLAGRFIWLCYQCIERQVITTGFSCAICELRSRTHACYVQPYLLFRENLLQRIEFSVNFAWPWVVVTALPTKLGTLESGRVSCNEFQIDLCLSDSCNSEQKRAARLFHRASPVAISLEPTREDGRGNSLREPWSPFYCKSTNCTMFPFAMMKFFPCNSLEN